MGNENLFCGVAFNYHDSSVAFGIGDKIKLVLEAERIFKKKKMRCNPQEMEDLIKIGLHILGKTPDEVDYWAMGTLRNPWLDDRDKISQPPYWRMVGFLGKKRISMVVNHHLAHATTYLYSPFKDATILTCDGGGDPGERTSVYQGTGDSLEKSFLDVSSFITAKPYDLISTYLYGYPRAEGKLMALAAFGTPRKDFLKKLEENIRELCTTDYEKGNRLLDKLFPGLNGKTIDSRDACDLAASLQYLFVKHRVRDVQEVVDKLHPAYLVLSGGACLNLEVNTRAYNKFGLPIFIPPCCDDTGVALGSLVYMMTQVNGRRPLVKLPFLGKGATHYSYDGKTMKILAQALIDDQIVLVHNSQAEIGPRALGNRSFIVRPDSVEMKRVLSQEIKQREAYRPLAPIVTEDKMGDYFIGPGSSPFMLHQYSVKPDRTSQVQGGIHKDGTSRVQTVTRTENAFMYDLIKSFGEMSGIAPVLLNTSLNLHGEPISNDLEDTLSISTRVNYPHKIVYNGGIIK